MELGCKRLSDTMPCYERTLVVSTVEVVTKEWITIFVRSSKCVKVVRVECILPVCGDRSGHVRNEGDSIQCTNNLRFDYVGLSFT